MVAASIVRVARELSRRRRVVAALLFFAYLSCVFIERRWARTAFDGGGAKHGILPRYANAKAWSGAPRDTHDKAEARPLLPASSSLGTDKKRKMFQFAIAARYCQANMRIMTVALMHLKPVPHQRGKVHRRWKGLARHRVRPLCRAPNLHSACCASKERC